MFEMPDEAAPWEKAEVVEASSGDIYLRPIGNMWIIARRPAAAVTAPPVIEISDKYPPPREPSPYLTQAPRLLRDACHAMRKDDQGRYCPRCSVRDFCEGQVRRAEAEAPILK